MEAGAAAAVGDACRRDGGEAAGMIHVALSADGFRVLAVATKDLGKGAPHATYSKTDGSDLVLVGYLAFLFWGSRWSLICS